MADVFHDGAETVQRLGGLAIKADVAVEVRTRYFVGTLDYDGRTVRLAYKPQYFSMSVFAEDYYLLGVLGIGQILLTYAFLQVQYHGAGGIYDVYVVLLCLTVC